MQPLKDEHRALEAAAGEAKAATGW